MSNQNQQQPPTESSRLAEFRSVQSVYEDRNSQFKVRLTNAYRIAGIAALVAALEALALIRASGKDHLQPYVAVLDKNATILSLATPIRSTVSLDGDVKMEQMKRWIWEARTVTSDPRVQRALVLDVMAKTTGPATLKMREWYTKLQPFTLAQAETISISITSALPNDNQATSYRVTWLEKTADNSTGQETGKQYTGIFTYAIRPPESFSVFTPNPVGFYVLNFSWGEQG